MLKKMLCTLLSLLLFNVVNLAQTTSQEEKFKAKIVHWGLQKIVSVQLKSGEKLQGRVTEIKDDFFAVQLLQQGNITTRQISFTDVQKLSGLNEWDANKARTYIGLAGAILGVVVLVVGLTRSNDRQPKTVIFSSR
ncbi:MAG TPA: hypothetical protein VFZ34_06480 [Blastocatellia bacterium]|nr:hypothetical protein [Blastocatellia bacterium]